MKNYFISIVFLIFVACNSSDNNTPNKSQNINKDKQHKEIRTDSNSKTLKSYTVQDNQRLNTDKVPSISELWNTYKECKAKAQSDYEKGDIQSMIKNYEVSANAAIELSRDDLAAWQFNNIGYYSIEEFKKKTDYQNRVRNLAIMNNQTERSAYFNETKQIFKQNYHLLKNCEPYIKKAKMLDRKYKHSDRTESIKSNLNFIQWVKKFLRK